MFLRAPHVPVYHLSELFLSQAQFRLVSRRTWAILGLVFLRSDLQWAPKWSRRSRVTSKGLRLEFSRHGLRCDPDGAVVRVPRSL